MDCVDILDHEAELAALAGLNETPQGLWPDWSDERVDAVIGLAGRGSARWAKRRCKVSMSRRY